MKFTPYRGTNKMTVTALAACVLLTGTLAMFADTGERPVRTIPSRVERNRNIRDMETPYFKSMETSVDLFGSYTAASGNTDRFKDGFGGGLGVNHFFTKHFGLGLDAYAWEGDRPRNGITAGVSGSLIARYPIEEIHLAPYVFGGVGGIFTESRSAQPSGHLGGGLEYRFTEHMGVFSDVRYVFADEDNDYALPRLGIRYAF